MSETPSFSVNAAQIDYWNAEAGVVWSRFQDRLDRQLSPLGEEAIRALAPRPRERILDVGCGCGQSTFDLAAKVTASGAVMGVDVSKAMLEAARARSAPSGAARPEFRALDAQTGDFGEGAFDAVFSRFGVMFFADPAAAFENLRRALRPGGRLAFVCWRGFADNIWMRAPWDAAQPWLAPPQPADPEAPGPFAFADPARVSLILRRAGFLDVALRPFDGAIGRSSVDEAVELALRIGPLAAALREQSDQASLIIPAVRAAISAYDTPSGVLMPAAVWIVTASAPLKLPS